MDWQSSQRFSRVREVNLSLQFSQGTNQNFLTSSAIKQKIQLEISSSSINLADIAQDVRSWRREWCNNVEIVIWLWFEQWTCLWLSVAVSCTAPLCLMYCSWDFYKYVCDIVKRQFCEQQSGHSGWERYYIHMNFKDKNQENYTTDN